MLLHPELTAAVNFNGGVVDCTQLTANGHRKLRLELRKNDVVAQIELAPAQVADFAAELQEVIDWLSE